MHKSLLLLALLTWIAGCASGRAVFEPRSTPPPPRAAGATGQATAAGAHLENGIRLYDQKKYRQAAKMFEQALKHNPASFKAAYYLGMCDNHRGRHAEARDHFRLALELGPDRKTQASIHVGLAYGYEMGRDLKRAESHYEQALDLDPENAYAREAIKRNRSGAKPKKSGG